MESENAQSTFPAAGGESSPFEGEEGERGGRWYRGDDEGLEVSLGCCERKGEGIAGNQVCLTIGVLLITTDRKTSAMFEESCEGGRNRRMFSCSLLSRSLFDDPGACATM